MKSSWSAGFSWSAATRAPRRNTRRSLADSKTVGRRSGANHERRIGTTFLPWLPMAIARLAGWVTWGGFGWLAISGRASGPTASMAPKGPKPDKAELQPAEFARLRALIRPHPGESRWADLTWESSLWA